MPSYLVVVTRIITSTIDIKVDANTRGDAHRIAISIARERDDEEWDCEGAIYEAESEEDESDED